MNKIDHWFRFNIGDYLADTMHFTTMQHGIYILFLLHAYKHGGRLPDSKAELARIARLDNAYSRRLMAPVLTLFERQMIGGYSHKRVLQELEKAKTISSMGKHAAAHRWPKGNSDADRIPVLDANQEQEQDTEVGRYAPSRAHARATDRPQNAFMELGQALARHRKAGHDH